MIATYFVNSLLVAVAVLIHFEVLNMLSMLIPKLPIRPRLRVLVGIFGSLVAHIAELWVFACGYYFMFHLDGFGGTL